MPINDEIYLSPKSTLIVGNGEKPGKSLLAFYLKNAQRVLALDGASNWLVAHKVIPDLIIGDFDSLDPKLDSSIPRMKIADQNSNDLAKAFHFCRANNHHEISVLGVLSLRADHFLTNLFVLKQFASSLTITFVDSQHFLFMCPQGKQLDLLNRRNAFISFFPLGDEVGPIWSTGVEYTLTNEMLSLKSRIGTLNRIVDDRASLYCEQGDLVVILQYSSPVHSDNV
jgi:thiamine pyrophosphokinase